MIRVNAHGYPRHDELREGSRARLAALRAESMRLNAMPHRANNRTTWRDARYRKFSGKYAAACMGRTFDEPCITAFSADALPVRAIRYADDVSRYIKHKGWYSDDEGRGIVRGIVASLSHGRYLTGYEWSDNGEFVLFLDVYTDEGKAAGIADEQAERFADICRDDAARFDAMQDAENRAHECDSAFRKEWKRYRMGYAMRVHPGSPLALFDSIISDSYFSGLLFRFTNQGESVIVGRYFT